MIHKKIANVLFFFDTSIT